MSGIGCPKCASPLLVVLDSRRSDQGVRRRRKCHACGYRFSTMESPIPDKPRPRLVDSKIEDPMWSRDHDGKKGNNRFRTNQRNAHESPIEWLYDRAQIDDAQKMAADRFRAIWESMGGKGASSIDFSKDIVDGGRGAQDITASQINAGQELRRCFVLLKARDYSLVSKICGEGRTLVEIAETPRARNSALISLQGALSSLAAMWNLKTRRRAS